MTPRPDDRDPVSAKLDALGKRLDALERDAAETGTITRRGKAEGNPALGSALKLSTEFVAALLVGGFLGWAADRALGLTPALFLTGLALGVGAGFMGVFRAARAMQARDAELSKNAPAAPARDDEEE